MNHRTSKSTLRSLARHNYPALATLFAAVAMVPVSARAAVIYYDTNGATAGTGTGASDWNSSSTNWTTDPTGSIAAVAWPASGATNLDGSDVVFSAGTNGPTAYTINPAGSKIANSITVNQGTINLRVIGASAVNRTVLGGGITVSASTAGQSPTGFNINLGTAGVFNVFLGASQSWTNNDATAPFSVGVTINGNATAGNTNTLTTVNHSSASMNISGAIVDGTAGGKVALVNSLGSLTLSGADTYSGGTTLAGGTTTLDSGGSLAHANLTLTGGTFRAGATGNGGTLTDNVSDDLAELISLSGTGVLDLTNLKLNLNVTGTQTQPEYVLASAPVGSANVTGTQFLSTSLPSGWSINDTGTAANPNAIVLLDGNVGAPVPEPASIATTGAIAALALARRRRNRA